MKTFNRISLQILIQQLSISLGVVLFIRLVSFLPIPEINHIDLALYIQTNAIAKNIIRTFSSETTFVISLFTLGIFPYINASIFVQLIIAFSPYLSQLQKEGDLNARRYINRLTRFISLGWSIIQSCGIAFYLRQILFTWNLQLGFEIVVWLTTGSMIILWLSELITDYGLGNGASLLIYINIVISLPNLSKKVLSENILTLNWSSLLVLITLFIFLLLGIVLLQEGVRQIPLLSASQLNSSRKQKKSFKQIELYLPIRLNQAGVMPIILTTAVLVLPYYVINFNILPIQTLPNLGIISKIIYWISYFGLILLFSSFYSTIVLNPKDVSDQLLKSAITIPNIQTGPETTYYLKNVMNRLSILGSLILAILATIPNFLEAIFNISNLNGLSVTSLLIVAGVLVDISKEIDDIVYSNVYKK